MPSTPLNDIPDELLVAISLYIDDRKDLLNISLTCKRIRRVILPQVSYHTVLQNIRSRAVWKAFKSLSTCACYVRYLGLSLDMGANRPIVGPRFQVPQELRRLSRRQVVDHHEKVKLQRNIEDVLDIVRNMRLLRHLTWPCYIADVAHILAILIPSCTQLFSLHLLYYSTQFLKFVPQAPRAPLIFHSIVRLVLQIQAEKMTCNPSNSLSTTLLSSFPSLAHLWLHFAWLPEYMPLELSFDHVLKEVLWPNLTTFHLTNNMKGRQLELSIYGTDMTNEAKAAVLHSFFRRHTHLRVLKVSFGDDFLQPGAFTAGCPVNLETLSLPFTKPFRQIPLQVAINLLHIEIYFFSEEDSEVFLKYLPHMERLEDCFVGGSYAFATRLFDVLPLSVKKLSYKQFPFSHVDPLNINEVGIRRLTNLTHISGLNAFVKSTEKNLKAFELLLKELSVLPHLKFVHCWWRQASCGNRWLIIGRGDDGGYAGYRYTTLTYEEVFPWKRFPYWHEVV